MAIARQVTLQRPSCKGEHTSPGATSMSQRTTTIWILVHRCRKWLRCHKPALERILSSLSASSEPGLYTDKNQLNTCRHPNIRSIQAITSKQPPVVNEAPTAKPRQPQDKPKLVHTAHTCCWPRNDTEPGTWYHTCLDRLYLSDRQHSQMHVSCVQAEPPCISLHPQAGSLNLHSTRFTPGSCTNC